MCQYLEESIYDRLTSRCILKSVTLLLLKVSAFEVLSWLVMAFETWSRSGAQFHGCTFHLRSAETNLTLICPSPKSFVCNLPDPGRHVTSVFQGLSLSRSVGRVGENPGNEVDQRELSSEEEIEKYWWSRKAKGFTWEGARAKRKSLQQVIFWISQGRWYPLTPKRRTSSQKPLLQNQGNLISC